MPLYWMSFSDPNKPKGERFAGVCIINAETPLLAMRDAWSFGCNPGGQVQFAELADDTPVPAEAMNRLLSLRELAARNMIDAKVH